MRTVRSKRGQTALSIRDRQDCVSSKQKRATGVARFKAAERPSHRDPPARVAEREVASAICPRRHAHSPALPWFGSEVGAVTEGSRSIVCQRGSNKKRGVTPLCCRQVRRDCCSSPAIYIRNQSSVVTEVTKLKRDSY